MLNETLRLFDHHLGDLYVALRGLVECGTYHLALHGALHVGDLLGTLIDEQDDEHHLLVIFGDGVGDILQQDGLAGFGRRNDQAALAFAYG